MPLYVERLVAAVPHGHALAARKSVDWSNLRDEEFLIQEWDESQAAVSVPGVMFRPIAETNASVQIDLV